MEARKTGIAMVVAGGLALAAAMLVDAIRYESDDALATREGIFDLSVPTHVVFFAGMSVAVLGALVLVFGPWLFRAGRPAVVPIVAGIAALGLVGGAAAAASASKYSDPVGDHHAPGAGMTAVDHHATDTPAADHHATDAPAADHHATDTSAADHHATDPGAMDHGAMDHGTDADTASVEAGQVIPGTADGTSPCEVSQPAPASPGQVGTGEAGSEGEGSGEHGHRGMVKQHPLTREEFATLQEQMRQARTVVDKYPTVAAGEAAGYGMSTPFVPCIGAHYTNAALAVTFDPAAPSELLFDGTAPDSKLIGLSYLVWHPGGAPEGFAGKNDPWHQHNFNGGLCFGASGVVIGGEELSAEDCAARGGAKRELTDIWMMHAWVVPGWECSWGVFSGECPELGGTVGKSAWE